MTSSSKFISPETGALYAVSSGGVITGTITGNAGLQRAAPGLQTISSGSATSGSTISGTTQTGYPDTSFQPSLLAINATQNILSGGAALNTTLSGTHASALNSTASALQTLQSGAYASGTTLDTNAQSIVFNGAISDAVTINNGSQVVSSGGLANAISISAGTLDLEQGSASNVMLNTGTIIDNGGSLNSATINAGTMLSLNATASNTTVTSGATVILGSGASLLGSTTIDPSATLSLTGASTVATLSGTIIPAGAALSSPQGALAPQSTPVLEIFSNGTLINDIAVHYTSTPFQFLQTPTGSIELLTNSIQQTTPTFTNPETGAVYTLSSGGVISGTYTEELSPQGTNYIPIPGAQVISSGSAISGSTISGTASDASPGEYIAATAIPSSQTVLSGGAALNTTVSGSVFQNGVGMSSEQYYSSSTATQILQSGAYASNTTLSIFANSIIQNGAISDNVAITGTWVSTGQIMTPSYVTEAGSQTVLSGGTLNTASITSGGVLDIEGGTANNITTLSGYVFESYPQPPYTYQSVHSTPPLASIIDNGGTLSNVSLVSGTQLIVGSNTTVTNLTASAASTITLMQNADLLGNVTIDPNTTIFLQGAGAALSNISGFINSQNVNTLSIQSDDQESNTTILDVLSNGTIINEIALHNAVTSFSFVNAPSGNGTDLVIGTPCYCPGTLIMTPTGERPVEDLAIGDLIVTANGQHRTVHWIGRRAYDPIFAFGNRDILPVCFRAGSLGNNLPKRDLTVSPLHAMFLDGYLIPALHLVNNHTIHQITQPETTIAYIHIELESHDLLLAEGAPSESFVDDGSRGMFHNAHHYTEQYPHAAPKPAAYCAPRLEGGPELARIHARLLTGAYSPMPKTA
ncbi:Hint domain-containing protein [Neokomagataea thailandica]|uniref:Type I secretion target repeat protein n=1 Tax=Neokomagataea tanensis NBRC 106556 TaxID=1223519 RepID=A0ABQ0QIP2_9PROT|nr:MULTISPECIES: Hint domain-containing protein [Neokomagataea]GBR46076.1 type I secretion target repeat protein [Neokomagataea tanensis NBRC 106556]